MTMNERGPLDGIRVVDMASVVAGPSAARLLADFGADVIKVEPPAGDPTRRLGWRKPGDDDSLFWKIVGRNKRTITLDLKAEEDLETMLRLLDTADVLIENMRPGKLEALGLAPAALHEHNPRLVLLRISGFGQTGPYAPKPGFATLAEAMAGFAAISGERDGPPLLPPVALTDELTAIIGAFGAMVGLWEVRRSGKGQVVDLGLIDSMLQVLGPLPSAYAHLGYLQPRLGAGIPYTVPRGTYRCEDGVWVAVSTSSDAVAARVLAIVGAAEDERFSTFEGRFEHRAELEKIVSDWIGNRSSEEVMRAFEEADAAIARVYDMSDIFSDAHLEHRKVFIEVDGIVMQAVVPRFSRTPGRVRFAGHTPDADREEILRDWGLTAEA